MKNVIEIVRAGRIYPVNNKLEISPRQGVEASGNWKLIGVIRFNNFGNVVEQRPFIDIDSAIVTINDLDWHYKNGKQRWYIMDLDHDTKRIWMNPTPYYAYVP